MKLSRRNFVQWSGSVASTWAAGAAWALDSAPSQTALPSSMAGDAPAPDAIYALVDHCLNTRYESLPADVIAVTKNQIMDTIAVALPALGADGIKQLYELTLAESKPGKSFVLGTSVRLPAAMAARLNAARAAALEYDDTYEPSLMHASCVTIPVALAIADTLGNVNGKDLIATVATSTDIACRLSRAGSPGVSPFIVGWDPTPLYGYLSAAIVTGRLMGMRREQIVSAVGLAYHQAAGNAEASIESTHGKRLGAGFASYGGIISALLVRHGVVGSQRPLEGLKGFFKQYHGGKYSKDLLLGGLGTDFAGPGIAPKPYPCCRGGHVAIDGALDIVKANNFQPADIERVTVYSPPAELMLLGAPLEKKQNPQTIVEAQFSNPWLVAVAIQDREVGLRHFTTTALQRDDLHALARRVFVMEDKSLVRPDGGVGYVRLEFKTRRGQTYTKQVNFAKGDPKNPMTAEEYHKKVYDCTDAAGLKRANADTFIAHTQALEKELNVSMLNTILTT